MLSLLAQGSSASGSIVPYIVGALAVLFPGGVVAFFKFRPEKEALVITATQGATTILNGVIEALEAQHERDLAEIIELRRQLAEARSAT